jgi:hypothetical protein
MMSFPATAQVDSRLTLTASNFFQPIRSSYQRNPEWPERLALDPYEMWPDDFRNELKKHTWRMVYECYGRPLTSAYLDLLDVMDGYLNPGAEFLFDETIAHRMTFRYPDAKPTDVDETETFDVPYSVGKYGMVFEIKYGQPVNPADVQPARVRETGETVLEFVDFHVSKVNCPEGGPVRGVLVPVNDAIM